MGGKLKTSIGVLLMSALVALPRPAQAQDRETCNGAYETADLLLAAEGGGDLLAAREKLRICTGPDCKDWMTKECAERLVAVEARIPSVVFEITDGGNAVVDVKAAIKERVLFERNDGRAIERNPGPYSVVFTLPDGRSIERTVVLHEGVKGRVVNIAFTPTPPPPPPPAPVTATPAPAPVVRSHRGSWPFTLAGFGIATAGAAVGTITGIAALNRVSTLESRCTGTSCPANLEGTRDAGQRLGNISTIAFIVSGAGVALGFLMFPDGPITIGVGPGSVGAAGRF